MIISEEIIEKILQESKNIKISSEKNYNLEQIITEIKEITKDFDMNEITKKISENFSPEIEEEIEKKKTISTILNYITFKEIESYEKSLKITLINREKHLDLLNINEEKKLTQQIFSKNPENQITCMGINFDYFYYGDIFGNVNVFSISDKKFLRTLEHPKKKTQKSLASTSTKTKNSSSSDTKTPKSLCLILLTKKRKFVSKAKAKKIKISSKSIQF